MKSIAVSLILVSLLSCSSKYVISEDPECSSSQPLRVQYQCYRMFISNRIYAQIGAYLRDWYYIDKLDDSTNIVYGVILRIRLTQHGEVRDVRILETSGDARYDEMAIESMKRLEPLPLPSNKKLRNALRTFVVQVY